MAHGILSILMEGLKIENMLYLIRRFVDLRLDTTLVGENFLSFFSGFVFLWQGNWIKT